MDTVIVVIGVLLIAGLIYFRKDVKEAVNKFRNRLDNRRPK